MEKANLEIGEKQVWIMAPAEWAKACGPLSYSNADQTSSADKALQPDGQVVPAFGCQQP
jgi:hypothetical protein